MDTLQATSILEFNSDTLETVRKQYDLDKPGQMDKSIDILEDWIKKQEYFAIKTFDRNYLERMIILCKGSVERAKKIVDKMLTYKTLLPKYFTHDFSECQKWGTIITDGLLPRMTEDHYRVYLLRNIGNKFDIGFFSFYQRTIAIAEYIHAYDYCNGVIIVYDCVNASVKDIALNINLIEFQETMSIITEGYGIRIKGFHIITSSNFVGMLLSIFKQALSTKLRNRIYVHKNFEEVNQYVPKDILPVEYGGSEKPLRDINDNVVKVFSDGDFNEFLRRSNKFCTIEELRPKDILNEQVLGMPGTFRTLCVD